MTDNAEPIRLDLFNRVDDYADSIVRGAVTSDSVIENTPIYVFYENFFLQFFDNVMHEHITGFDRAAQDKADGMRLSLEGSAQAPVRRMIEQFEDFCELRAELPGGMYFTSDDDFVHFHEYYIPRLLQTIEEWAASAGLPELAQRAKQAPDLR